MYKISITSVACTVATSFIKQLKANCNTVELIDLDGIEIFIGKYFCDLFAVIRIFTTL